MLYGLDTSGHSAPVMPCDDTSVDSHQPGKPAHPTLTKKTKKKKTARKGLREPYLDETLMWKVGFNQEEGRFEEALELWEKVPLKAVKGPESDLQEDNAKGDESVRSLRLAFQNTGGWRSCAD